MVIKAKPSYKDKPPYKAIYGIEAAFMNNAALMHKDIVKKIEKTLSNGIPKSK